MRRRHQANGTLQISQGQMSVQDARNVGNFTIGFICYKLCTNRPFAGFSHMSLFCAMLGRKPIEEYFAT